MPERANTILRRAVREHRPRRIFVLLSGGGDSTVLADWAARCAPAMRGRLAAVHIDTGTAIPGVMEHAAAIARMLDLPFVLYQTPREEFEQMVLEHGFPGPGRHDMAYIRLKERQLDALVRQSKVRHDDRVMLLAGARAAESVRRMGHATAIDLDGATVWVNPLNDWSDAETEAYRRARRLPISDVAALLHRSGECNCGAYAGQGEREMLMSLFPEWWAARIAPLEAEAERRGIRWCRWGGYDVAGVRAGGEAKKGGRLCADCPAETVR